MLVPVFHGARRCAKHFAMRVSARFYPARISPLLLVIFAAVCCVGCTQVNAPQSSGTTTPKSIHASADDANAPHDEHSLVRLSDEQISALGVKLAPVAAGKIELTKAYPGKVQLNQNRYAHVVARVAGVAASVPAAEGESVKAGDVLAVLESRALAQATATYLGTREQSKLADDYFARLHRLFGQGIVTEREHLQARQMQVEAQIKTQAAQHTLRALGFSKRWIDKLPNAPEATRFRYPLTAPFSGVIIKRHLTQGEAVLADTETFEIADLSEVWVDFSIFLEDMAKVHEGQHVSITANGLSAEGTIAYVRPIVSDDTRAGLARVVLRNPEQRWKPGLFATVTVTLDSRTAPRVIAKSALQTIADKTVVFVKTDAGFVAQPVRTGIQDAEKVAITQGLAVGQPYVTEGAFSLKSELAKGSFEAGHTH